MAFRRTASFIVIACAIGTSAWAQAGSAAPGTDKPAKAHRAAHHPKPARASAAAPETLDQIRSDLLHGSAEQQQLERSDSDLSSMRPVDHHKDDFFSDWKGLQ